MKIYNIKELGLSKNILKEGKKGIDYLLPIWKRFSNFLHIPYADDCCDEIGDAGAPVGYANDSLQYYDIITKTYLPLISQQVIDVTYTKLITAITDSILVAGQQYRITDYATIHYIVDANSNQYLSDIITGVNEPLIVTANSINTIDKEAKSALHPEDIIHYDPLPNKWLQDSSFSDLTDGVNDNTIILGFKGVIYFRHDTVLDNYMGYDFRNCKFRRWKTDCVIWDDVTEFSKNNFVNYDGFIYRSIKDGNINQTPASGSEWWIEILNLSLTEYWNNKPNNSNGIPTDNGSFIDVKTFAEGVGTATYEVCCKSNHFEPFKDDSYYYDYIGTLLPNNVFFLQDNNYYQIYSNEFAAENYRNTIGSYMALNKIDSYFVSNFISGSFQQNTISNNFANNNIRNDFAHNTILTNFDYNNIGSGFYSNNCGSSFSSNNIGINFIYNKTANLFTYNTIANNFVWNSIGNLFQSNTIKSYFQTNTIGDYFFFNTLDNYFQHNSIGTHFLNNTIAYNFGGDSDEFNKGNIVGNYFVNNTTLGSFHGNTIGIFCGGNQEERSYPNTFGDSFYDNTIGNQMWSNTIGEGANNNNIGNNFKNNTIGIDFRYNNIENNSSFLIDYTAATLVYEPFSKTIFKNSGNVNRLSYYNASDILTIANPTD